MDNTMFWSPDFDVEGLVLAGPTLSSMSSYISLVLYYVIKKGKNTRLIFYNWNILAYLYLMIMDWIIIIQIIYEIIIIKIIYYNNQNTWIPRF